MAWDEWEQLKQGAGQPPAGEGPGRPGGLKSVQRAWNRAGAGVGGLREGIGKALVQLEDGQSGLGSGAGCLSSGAQTEVYDSWARYVTAVDGRCDRVRTLLEQAGRDLFTTDEAVRASFGAMEALYADTPAVGGQRPGR
ncbi:hypothetical protein OG893_22150 [Streptomyces sp. NBC_01696]|uniref:hypothetical protein n=1 Tax=Streptomyces sp. NBC_01696 TaxID=2975913 RepID=UPI002E3456B5|nr:hypothetical protein [Streptomyces sp. NBC_01696]